MPAAPRQLQLFGTGGGGLGSLLGSNNIAAQFLLWTVGNQIAGALLGPIIEDVSKTMWEALPTMPLSPADAADAAERNILDKETAANHARKSGVGGDVFDTMYQLTGEPPGLIDMLRLWRRGDLDEATLRKMIAFSRVRTEWTDHVLALAHDVMPASDAVEATLKGIIDTEEGRKRYAQAGGRADDFDLVLEAAGNPIGVEAAARLFNHKLISEAEFHKVILASRINPRFESIAALLHVQFLSAFQIERMLTTGTATVEEATRWLIEDGYPPDQVAAFVGHGAVSKSAKVKEAAESVIVDSYEAGMMSKAQAIAELTKIGYDPHAAPILIDSYDAKRILALKQQGVTAVRHAYLLGKVDNAKAGTDLDALGVDPVLKDHYVATWAIERRTQARELTTAEIGSLAKKGVISWGYAIDRWLRMGYSSVDATLLSYEHGAPVPKEGTGL